MRFTEGEIAILNQNVSKGLPDRVGEFVTIIDDLDSFNYDYQVALDDGDLVHVRDRELNKPTEEQLQLMSFIKRGNKVLYAAMNEVVEIVKVDMVHAQVEVKYSDGSMNTLGFEQIRQINFKEDEKVEVNKVEYKLGDKLTTLTEDMWNDRTGEVVNIVEGKYMNYYDLMFSNGESSSFDETELRLAYEPELYEEEVVVSKEAKFKIGDKVKTITDDHWGNKLGVVSGFEHYDDNSIEYHVDYEDKIGVPYSEHELELVSDEDVNNQLHFDLLFGHFEQEDGNFLVPKQLLHNLLNKIL
jgi:hypothetical protein